MGVTGMLGYGKNNQLLPVEWKDSFEGHLGVAVQDRSLRQNGREFKALEVKTTALLMFPIRHRG